MPITTLVTCADMAAYRHAIRTLSDAEVPVLGTEEAHRELATALGVSLICFDPKAARSRAKVHDASEPNARALILARDDRYLPFAALLAERTGRTLVVRSELDRLQHGLHADSLLFVCEPEALTHAVLAELARASADDAAARLGLLTARTCEAMSGLIARLLCSSARTRQRDVSVAVTTESGQCERHTYLSRSDATSLAARSLLHEPFDALIVGSHGGSIDLDLHAVTLCGGSKHSSDGSWPCLSGKKCMRDPAGDRPRLPIDALCGRVLFAESCSGMAFTTGTGVLAASLALGAVDGSLTAYFGTYKLVRSSHGAVPVLAGAMLASGYAFGDVLHAVNRVQGHLTGDVPSYVLLGDPVDALPADHEPIRLRLHEVLSSLPVSFELALEGQLTRLLDLTCPLQTAGEVDLTNLCIDVRLEADAEVPGIAVAVPSEQGTAVRVLVALLEPRTVSSVSVSLTIGSAGHTVPAWLERATRALDTLELVREGIAASSADLTRVSTELDALLTQARHVNALAQARLEGHADRITRLERPSIGEAALRSAYGALDLHLVNEFPGWGLTLARFGRAYAHRLKALGRELSDGPCAVCGAPRFSLHYDRPPHRALRRVVRHCAQCGLLADGPAEALSVTLDGPARLTVGELAHFALRVHNDADHPITVAAAAFFPQTPAGAFRCRAMTLELRTGASGTLPIPVEACAGTARGTYGFSVVVSSLLELQLLNRSLELALPEVVNGRRVRRLEALDPHSASS